MPKKVRVHPNSAAARKWGYTHWNQSELVRKLEAAPPKKGRVFELSTARLLAQAGGVRERRS